MSKPAFDPNQPFASAKPAFDPNAPFTATDTASPEPSMMQKAGNYIQNKAVDFAAGIATPRAAVETYGSRLPAVGAVLGGPVGAGVGAIAKNMAQIAVGDPNAPTTPWRAALEPMLQTGLAGLPETDEVKAGVQQATQGLARRSLGFTKGMMKKFNFGVPEANQVGQTMLDKGVIKAGSGTPATLARAEDLAQTSGKAIGDIGSGLTQRGLKTIDPNAVGEEISKQLMPPYSGGAYDAEKKVVGEILDTVGAHGNGPIDFESAQALKQKLGEIAKFNSTTDAAKAGLYRRAYGIVSKALDDAVQAGTEGTNKAGEFLANKKLYGQSQKAIGALSDKAAGEAANNLVSLRGAAMGGLGLATGNLHQTAEAIGLWELLRRRGEGTGAALLNSLNKSDAITPLRRAAMASFVDKVTTRGGH